MAFELSLRTDKPKTSPIPEIVDPEDRGRARYFHGRERELGLFRTAMRDARRGIAGGTIFLVQGPPGAGKTAFLHVCKNLAEAEGWGAAYISTLALANPNELAWNLNRSNAQETTKYRETGGDVGAAAVVHGSKQPTRGKPVVYSGGTVSEIIREAATPDGLVLILDEAQDLWETGRRSQEVNDDLRLNLRLIHNGDTDAPVLLLAGGLGTTETAFGTFGISRFKARRIHHLGALSVNAATAVIRDWLIKGGGAPQDHTDLTQWVATLAAECHGWPQHLQIYAQHAAGWLRRNSGELTPEVPADVLAHAKADRDQYYVGRTRGFILPHRTDFARLLQERGKDALLTKNEILAALALNQPQARAEKMYNDILHKGVIAETESGGFKIPIPSMHDWLVEGIID